MGSTMRSSRTRSLRKSKDKKKASEREIAKSSTKDVLEIANPNTSLVDEELNLNIPVKEKKSTVRSSRSKSLKKSKDKKRASELEVSKSPTRDVIEVTNQNTGLADDGPNILV